MTYERVSGSGHYAHVDSKYTTFRHLEQYAQLLFHTVDSLIEIV